MFKSVQDSLCQKAHYFEKKILKIFIQLFVSSNSEQLSFFREKKILEKCRNYFSQLSEKLFVKERNVHLYLVDILSNFGILRPIGREDISHLLTTEFPKMGVVNMGVVDVQNFGRPVFMFLLMYSDHPQPVSAW